MAVLADSFKTEGNSKPPTFLYVVLIIIIFINTANSQNIIHEEDLRIEKVSEFCFDYIGCNIYYYSDDKYSGTVIFDTWENGNVRSKVETKNGRANGTYEVYYENGEIRTIVDYVDGSRNGRYLLYHKNGQIAWRTKFVNGYEQGLIETFHENGQLYYRANYVDGRLKGPYVEYDRSGNLVKQTTY